MTAYFLDSSALVNRYIPELGTAWVRAITAPSAGNTLVVAQITPVEVISGIARRRREGVVALRTAQAVRILLDRHVQREYLVIALTAALVRQAQDLLEQHSLRAYDALQLATALAGAKRLLAAGLALPVFVSADTRLLSVAAMQGLATEDPNAHP